MKAARRTVALLSVAAVVFTFAAIWLPEIAHNWASPSLVDGATVERSRNEPADRMLDTVRRQSMSVGHTLEQIRDTTVEDAEAALRGESRMFSLTPVQIAFPFAAANLDVGSPTMQLHIASLSSAEALLRAYRLTSDEKYFQAAQTELLAFARVDRRTLVPHGFLWNDHALAARMAVLADWWSLARKRPDLTEDAARAILSLARRTGERLARPGLYTFRSNHGVMQNIALIQAGLAFPALERSEAWRRLGCARLAEQMGYYTSPEGPVLEHSAGYHLFGTRLLIYARDLASLARCPEKVDWSERLSRGDAYTAVILRPDGSLPAYGNTMFSTGADLRPVGSQPVRPGTAVTLLPVAGHAVWWDGLAAWPDAAPMSQTVVTWSNYPSRAHKLADDMSVILWSGGFTWVTNVGYWPYGVRGEKVARGWRGSNAPHREGEPFSEPGSTSLLLAAADDRVRVIELERTVAAGQALRRTIVDVDGRLWLVADTASLAGDAPVDRVWTVPPNITSTPLADGGVLLRSAYGSAGLRMSFLGDLASTPQVLQGSVDPFGGWVVGQNGPVAATSWVVTQPPNGTLVMAIFARGDAPMLKSAASAKLERMPGQNAWAITLPGTYGVQRVAWDGKTLRVTRADGSTATLAAEPPSPEAAVQRAAIVAAFMAADSKYKRLPEFTHYRTMLTVALLLALSMQETAFFGLHRLWPERAAAWGWKLRVLSIVGWLAVAGLIDLWYLA